MASKLLLKFGIFLCLICRLSASPAEPRLVITQVGLHFICTGDGQPDIYSWRIPMKGTTPGSAPEEYFIPEIPESELANYAHPFESNPNIPNVSGGRTALRIDESIFNVTSIATVPLEDIGLGSVNLANLEAVHWGAESGGIKGRFYSNFPPLNIYASGGLYNTTNMPPSGLGSKNYTRNPSRHPGYDPKNWNHTLESDTPLEVNQKRIQAMLYFELYLPPMEEYEGNLDFTVVIPARDISSIEVNERALFNTSQDKVIKIQRSAFETPGVAGVGGFADARKLLGGRRVRGFGYMPEDSGYDNSEVTRPSTGLYNADVISSYLTVNSNTPLSFSSEVINLKIYNTHAYADSTPVQEVRFLFPGSQAPVPDLVTAGTFRVAYDQSAGSTSYEHPATQAPRWWGYHRDGILGRSTFFSGIAESFRGRLNRSYLTSFVSNEINARHPLISDAWAGNAPVQSVPGARALLYYRSLEEYPGVRLLPAIQKADHHNYGPREDDPLSSWDRPWHFGTDTLRTLANINRLVPKALVTEQEWIKPPGYDAPESHMAYGTGFDELQFTQHPTSQNLRVGDTAFFSADATSSSAVTWQWRRDGQNIDGATQSTLSISSVDGFDAGSYDVIATNAVGSITGNPAVLTVQTPLITAQPAGGVVFAGQPLVLSVSALGTGNVTYQWRKNGQDIPSATGSSLELSAATHRDQAWYDVVITDELNNVTSETAVVEIRSPAPVVTISPSGAVAGVINGEVTFTTTTTGPGTPGNVTSWQWRKNGINIAKARGPSLVLPNLRPSDAGVYDVVVRNIHGTALSNPAQLTLPAVVPVLGLPEDATLTMGESITLRVNVEGPATYQWLKDGRPVRGATEANFEITDAGVEAAGQYSVMVTTAQGKITTPGTLVSITDPGLLIYKLTATGTSHEGKANRKSAFVGWLVLDRAGQRGGFLFTGFNGRQKTHWTEMRESLRTRSTGPVPGSLTVISDLAGEDASLWLSGADSLISISKTDRTVGPRTLSGHANRLFPGEQRNQVEMAALKLVLNTAHSSTARRNAETVEQALARLSQEMQASGFALASGE